MERCPRSDPNDFKFGDIFELDCPACGVSVEFVKNEVQRKCPGCGETVVNTRVDPDSK